MGSEINNKLSWHSERTSQNYDAKGDNAYFSSDPYRSIIKESVQNSLDALKNPKEGKTLFKKNTEKQAVKIDFQVIKLSDRAKEQWLEAIDYKNSYKKKQELLLAKYKNEELASGELKFKEDLKELEATNKLLSNKEEPVYLLNFTDRNTVGLDGLDSLTDDTGSTRRFASLFKSTKDSIKGTGAGSWGLGKNSYAHMSQLSMFLACSNPLDTNSCGRDSTSDKYRLYGLSLHRTAKVGGDSNPLNSATWFFGEKKTKEAIEEEDLQMFEADLNKEHTNVDWSKSSWNNKTIIENLYINSLGDDNGTTIQIPALKTYGFEGNIEEEIASELAKNCRLWLWPAILAGKLEISISSCSISDSNKTLVDAEWEKMQLGEKELLGDKRVKPYIETFQKIEKKETLNDKYNGEDEYFSIPLTYLIPPKENSYVFKTSNGDDFIQHLPNLAIKRVSVNEKDSTDLNTYRNTVALIRSPGIVVEYERFNPEKENVAYVGILLAGNAFGESGDDVLAEDFLRHAENPSHNSWWKHDKNNNKLHVYFGVKDSGEHDWGSKKLSNTLYNPLLNAVREFFGGLVKESGSRNRWMENMLILTSPPKSDKPDFLSAERIKSNKVRYTFNLPSGKEAEVSFHPALVRSEIENELGGQVEIKKFTEKDKGTWNDKNKTSYSLINKEPNSVVVVNKSRNNKNIDFDIVFEEKTNSNINYGSSPLRLRYETEYYGKRREA